ncbi:hypothetical protein COV18_01745 [Candidatus Woesearchaeota archaeon CG10_big_fil_rev_8_21_14_0_10_37_12]|nr:MAG: hypothetical protein COV18_01745 [Candidatus Woesearchaeota archaeon CG10_big_fil_rev_8_21_14_0_10_37_12]
MNTHAIHDEWIGKQALVKKAANKQLEEIQGIVVDETKNTIHIETEKGIKKVPKKGTTFIIGGKTVQGNKVLVQPEERIKLKV